jgi:hypothetical protein
MHDGPLQHAMCVSVSESVVAEVLFAGYRTQKRLKAKHTQREAQHVPVSPLLTRVGPTAWQ